MQAEVLGPVDSNRHLEVSVVLKPRHSLADIQTDNGSTTRGKFGTEFGADPSDIDKVEAFASQHRLHVIDISQARSTVRLVGRADDMAAAFGVSLQLQRMYDGTEYRALAGPIHLPRDLEQRVVGVFGLDTRPIADPRPAVTPEKRKLASRRAVRHRIARRVASVSVSMPLGFNAATRAAGPDDAKLGGV